MEDRKYLDDVSRNIQDLILDKKEAKALIALLQEGTSLNEAEDRLHKITLRLKTINSAPVAATSKEEPFEPKPAVCPRRRHKKSDKELKGGCLAVFAGIVLLVALFGALLPKENKPKENNLPVPQQNSFLPIPKKEFFDCTMELARGLALRCNYTVQLTEYSTDEVLVDLICQDRSANLFLEAERLATFVAAGLQGLLEGTHVFPKEFDVRVVTSDQKLVGTAHYSPILKQIKWISGFK